MWDLSSPTRDQTCVPCIERWIFFGRGGGDFYFFYWRIIVYRILLFSVKPQERWILNHWTTREVPIIFFKSTFIADQLQHIHGSSPLSASMPLAMGLCSSSHLEGLASESLQPIECRSDGVPVPKGLKRLYMLLLYSWAPGSAIQRASIMGDDGLHGGEGRASSWQPASPNQLVNPQLTTHTWRNPADFSPAEPSPNYQL